eukprot:3430569-Amphidinium_carterae.1
MFGRRLCHEPSALHDTLGSIYVQADQTATCWRLHRSLLAPNIVDTAMHTLWSIMVLSRHSLAAAGVLLCLTSCFVMFTVTVVLMCAADVVESAGLGILVLTPAHLIAQFSALFRVVATLYSSDTDLEAWRRATTFISLFINVVQCIYLILMTGGDDGWEDAFIFSLVSLFFLDLVCAMLLHTVPDEEEKVPALPRVHMDCFTLKRGRTDVGPLAGQTCHICLEEFQYGDRLAKLRCGHAFHKKCIKKWVTTGYTCPLRCKSALSQPAASEMEETPQEVVIVEPVAVTRLEMAQLVDISPTVKFEMDC